MQTALHVDLQLQQLAVQNAPYLSELATWSLRQAGRTQMQQCRVVLHPNSLCSAHAETGQCCHICRHCCCFPPVLQPHSRCCEQLLLPLCLAPCPTNTRESRYFPDVTNASHCGQSISNAHVGPHVIHLSRPLRGGACSERTSIGTYGKQCCSNRSAAAAQATGHSCNSNRIAAAASHSCCRRCTHCCLLVPVSP
jgi:hypothetical protein